MAVPPKNHQQRARKRQIITFLIIRTVGNFLVLFAIFGVGATFGPAAYYEANYQLAQAFHVKYKIAPISNNEPSPLSKIIDQPKQQNNNANSTSVLGTILSGKSEEILYPQDPSFSVVIPKIGANERIYPNVDPNNPDEYLKVLMHGIAHAKGTAFPGLNGTTYLFAHSTDNFWNVGRYNAVFYLLDKLQPGDEVVVFFGGKRYNYTVYNTKIIDPSDTHYIASNMGKGERLILQTCWPPGTSWKRLLVFASPKV